MKFTLIMIAGFLIMVFGLAYINKTIVEEFSKIDNKRKAYLGTKYALQSDTLIIIDYSLINDTFTLSNGVKVNTATVFVK